MSLQQQLKDNIHHWQEAGAPESVINIIRDGVRLPFSRPQQRFTSRSLVLDTPAKQEAWAQIEAAYVANGAIRRATAADDVKCVSPSFMIKKKEAGQWRFIIDLRRLNSALKKLKCRYGRLTQLSKARGCHSLISFDLKDAYHHVGIATEHQKYLGFSVNGITYISCCLPFGLSISPAIFMMVSRTLKTLLLAGFDPDSPHLPLPTDPPWAIIVHYLDDFLICCRSHATAEFFASRVVRLCIYLGFNLHFGKSCLDPSSSLVSLGLEVDLATGHFRVTAARAAKLAQHAKRLLMTAAQSARHVKRCDVASFAGLAQSCQLAGPVYSLHIRQLYTDLHSTSATAYKVRLSHQALQSLRWFIRVPTFFSESPIWTAPPPTEQQQQQPPAGMQVLYTDASQAGWGAVFRAGSTQVTLAGKWPVHYRHFAIHVLELEAVLLAATALRRRLAPPAATAATFSDQRRTLHLFNDNQAVVHMLRRWTTRDPESLQRLYGFADLCGSLRMQLTVSYIQSACNPADSPSRIWEAHRPHSSHRMIPWNRQCMQLL